MSVTLNPNQTPNQRMNAVITRNDGPRFWADSQGQEFPCILRGRLKQEQLRVTSLLVVGDEVEVTLQQGGTGLIEAITPRRSELSRPGFHGYVHVMAANVDQMLIVAAAENPKFVRNTVERFLMMAGHGRITPVVVINKCDLRPLAEIEADVASLRQAGIAVLLVSAATGYGLEELRGRIAGRISVLAGQSGVGKSSLATTLYPELNLRTGRVSHDTGKGRHTTSNSRLIRLPDGGYLADTPGIRELNLFDTDDLAQVFPEIEALAGDCKFNNCTHTHEPTCAVKKAANRGEIDRKRLEHYQKLRSGK